MTEKNEAREGVIRQKEDTCNLGAAKQETALNALKFGAQSGNEHCAKNFKVHIDQIIDNPVILNTTGTWGCY